MSRHEITVSLNAVTNGYAAIAKRAVRTLVRRDRRMRQLVRDIGPFAPRITRDPFCALVGAIVHQQLSMTAAASVFGRLRGLCPRRRLTPGAILSASDEALRAAGLSRPKVRYVRGIAEAFAARRLTRSGLRRMDDGQVIETVTKLPGVGRWTAEMLLIFSLERPDVWPIDDLGLRKAATRYLGRDAPPDDAALLELGERFRPYRTFATWYLWKSLNGPMTPGIAP